MGRFQNLSHVGLVLSEVIEAAVAAGTEIRVNVPHDEPTSSQRGIRITLMWTTPQAAHRSDPPERNPDGTVTPPPPTLSAWYLISTYGDTDGQDAIGAHDLLGQIIRAFHIRPTLSLPIDGLGEGEIHVVQVPVDADLNEKIWTPLQVRQRPWALFDVAPIQLLRAEAPGPAQPIVHPGGIRLGPVDVADRPRISRVTPATIGRSGRVRLDATYTGAPSVVSVDATRIIPPNIVAMEDGGPVIVTLPAGLAEDTYDIRLTGAGNVASDPETLTVVEATRPSLDAPGVLRHSRATNLVLTGRALGAGAANVVFWPDSGISAPTDVITVTAAAAATSVTIGAADLVPLRTTVYRLSVQHAPHGFTPYVLLEIVP